MSLPYNKKTEIYIAKTIIEYDEYNRILSRNVFYDKEVKYHKVEKNINEPKYYSYELINSIPIKTQDNISPSISPPTTPTTPQSNSVIIDMSNLLYNTNNY